MRKLSSLGFVLLLCLTAGTALAAQRAPLRIAILPVMDQTGGWLDRNSAAVLSARLHQEFHVPLNGVLQAVEYVSPEDITAAYKTLTETARLQGKKPSPAETTRQLAAALPADLVLQLAVDSWYEHTYLNGDGDSCVDVCVGLTLYGWNQRTTTPVKESAGRCVSDDCAVIGGAERQGSEALEDLLQKTQLRKLVFPLQATR